MVIIVLEAVIVIVAVVADLYVVVEAVQQVNDDRLSSAASLEHLC